MTPTHEDYQAWLEQEYERCERGAGEILAGMHGHGSHGGNRKSSSIVELEDLGVTKKQSHRWQQAARIPAAQFEAFLAETRDHRTRGGWVEI